MPAVKQINGNYTITNKNVALANVVVATHTLFVDGNLLVGGNTTQVTKTELSVTDNTITLNKGEIGSGVTLGTAGIEVDRGSAANVSILWNESYDRWTLTADGTTFANIVSSIGSGTILTALADDPGPQLGGNLDTLNRSIFSSNTAYVRFADNVAINNTSVVPTALSANTVVYAQTPGSGGSGLYTITTTNSAREVASTRNAIVYSLVL